MSQVEVKTCKFCPAKIAFVRLQDGTIVPVDVSAPVYRIEWPSGKAVKIKNDGPVRAYASHWKTCTGADKARKAQDAKKKTKASKKKRASNRSDEGGSTTE
jgi:hypothetical protein